jgi:two-component system sensor histidine kinase MprB
MTLRARIALALAVLAGVAVLAVALAGYLATDARLRSEVDQNLEETARRFLDADGRVLAGLCGGGSTGRPRGPVDELVGRDSVVQCVDRDGEIVATIGSTRLPVDDADLALATAGRGGRTHTVVVDGEPYRIETVALPGGGVVQVAREYGETQDVLDGLRTQMLVIGVVVIAAGALAGWLIARRATRPLVELAAAAEEVADTGRLDVPLPPPGPDEPGRLSRAFGAMLTALQQSRDQQQQLVQDAGHELRTPLTSLRTNVETLRRYQELSPEAQAAILRDLDSESRELAGLVDELVQLATDTWSDEPMEELALDELVLGVAQRAERRTGRSVPVRVEGAPVIVVGRPRDLTRAVGNLVDNAAKFSPPDTPIEIEVVPGRVVVRDHGPGVAEEDRAHVFDRFYRSAEARALPGSGLGLAIVSQTARAHGGSVGVTNDVDGGAVFTLSIPTPS